jgi:superfamily II DNA or RNA helicase
MRHIFLGAMSYQKVCDYYNCPRVLFTASPARLDGKPLTLADILIQGISVKELIKKGNVADFEYYAPDLKIDLDQIDLIAGEYNNEQLEKEMDKPAIYGDILKYYKQLGENRQAIAYCVNIEHSKKVCKLFNDNNILAVHMDASTPEKQRAKILQDFKENKFKILCNCNLISEGITLPTASVGLLLRPTCSLPLFIQQSSRVLTPLDGKKAIIIDYVNNVEKHGLPNDDREWTLEGKIKKREIFNEDGTLKIKRCSNCFKCYDGKLEKCPFCGFKNIPTKREIENKKNIELKIITKEKAKQLEEERKQKRKEQGMAQSFGELVALAKKRGYKNPTGFAYMVMKGRQNGTKKSRRNKNSK